MKLISLQLKNYKNLDSQWKLSPGLNLLVATNGSGKTNFLEAINYLGTGKSLRGVADSAIFPLQLETNLAFIKAVVETVESPKQELILSWEKTPTVGGFNNKFSKRYLLNGKPTSPKKFRQQFHCVVYSPETLDLVMGGGGERRDFLDNFAGLLYSEAEEVLTQYQKVISQKNRLLKTDSPAREQELNFWNQKLVELGAQIYQYRARLLQELLPELELLSERMEIMIGDKLNYQIKSRYYEADAQLGIPELATIKTRLTKVITENTYKELAIEHSLYGPHRDDFCFTLADKEIQVHASRGQQRLFSFVLFAAATALLTKKENQSIIMLLDDILSELDDNHRSQILQYLLDLVRANPEQQIFLTTPTNKLLPLAFQKETKSLKNISLE